MKKDYKAKLVFNEHALKQKMVQQLKGEFLDLSGSILGKPCS